MAETAKAISDIPCDRLTTSPTSPNRLKTFHWLFDPKIVSFTRWLRGIDVAKNPIYWIQGKPGSGKSSLMKFAMRDLRLSEALKADTGETWTLAAFFFHDRGWEKQKTLVGMLQEVLRSVLDQVPALLPFVVPAYTHLVSKQRTRNPEWDLDQLVLAFQSILEQREFHVRILFLLDALDEHHGDNETLTSLIKDLTEKTDDNYVAIKWCLASRSWTHFEQQFGECPGFSIHDYTKQDISTYIESQLSFNFRGQHSAPHQDRLATLINTMTEKALGIFIWVRIVVDRIAKGVRDGTPFATLELLIQKIPQELSELYADTLRRVEPEYTTEAYIMLQIVFCSIHPIPLKSFTACLDYNYESLIKPGSPYIVDQSWTSFLRLHEDQGKQMRRVASRTGGLLETVSRSTQHDEDNSTGTLFIQFFHQTVKEYVQLHQDNLGLVDVPPDVLRENGNTFLLRSCQVSNDERICCIKKDVFVYAKLAEDTMVDATIVAQDPSQIDYELRSLRATSALIGNMFASQGLFDMRWWLEEQQGLFYTHLAAHIPAYKRSDSILNVTERRVEIMKICFGLAVAANLLHYVNEAVSEVPKGVLLWIAAAGPDIGTGSRKIDINRMIRDLLANQPDDRDDLVIGPPWEVSLIDAMISANAGRIGKFSPHVRSQKRKPVQSSPGSQPGPQFRPSTMIFPQALTWMILAAEAFSNRNEEVRLSVARTLLQSGADANARVLLENNGISSATSLLQLCTRYESAPFVRLLLEHGADPNLDALGPWSHMLFACIRKDEEIFRALRDFGLEGTTGSYDINGPSFWGGLVACSMMLAAASGGVSAA